MAYANGLGDSLPESEGMEAAAVDKEELAGHVAAAVADGDGAGGADPPTPNIMNIAYTASRQAFEEHMVSHMPFRAWCPHYVAGKAVPGKRVHGDCGKMGITALLGFCCMGPRQRRADCTRVCDLCRPHQGTLPRGV